MSRWLLLLLVGCAAGNSVLTQCAFYEIPLGASSEEVMRTIGEPYAIHKKEDGSIEYEYIEYLKVGGRNLQERHYFLLIQDGKVASKREENFLPPPFLFDSYEMQTTQQPES